ncbi:MAG: phosphoribosylamine--glycine ligase [Pseudomonadota bacterium]
MSQSSLARVLVVGSGGREHALVAAMARSPQVGEVAFSGGENAGISTIARHVPPDALLAEASAFDLVVIGPEAPLVEGMADALRAQGRAVFGPSAAAAELEASKAFTKEIAAEGNIPTARWRVAQTRQEGLLALEAMGAPVVVKADGLAAGKGVVVAGTLQEATAAVESCFDGAFGAAGARVVIEEKLEGPEVSLFALSDGITVRPLATARDYKRAFDGGMGPNTGGMGAISPAPDLPEGMVEAAMETIVLPALEGLKRRGIDYVGVLYAGLMLTADGPKLIEFNVRFGDPECQVILPRLTVDPYELCLATATGRLADQPLTLSDDVCVGVVVASSGYPGPYGKGDHIEGLDAVEAAGAEVFHAGTRREGDAVLSNGGRVLSAVALGSDREGARERVYGALKSLQWPQGRMRADIGL